MTRSAGVFARRGVRECSDERFDSSRSMAINPLLFRNGSSQTTALRRQLDARTQLCVRRRAAQSLPGCNLVEDQSIVFGACDEQAIIHRPSEEVGYTFRSERRP